MLSLETLLDDRATVEVRYRKHRFNVTFRPGAFNVELDSVGVIEFLAKLVESWDLTHEGVMVPITEAKISELIPVPVQLAIRTVIVREVMVNPEA